MEGNICSRMVPIGIIGIIGIIGMYMRDWWGFQAIVWMVFLLHGSVQIRALTRRSTATFVFGNPNRLSKLQLSSVGTTYQQDVPVLLYRRLQETYLTVERYLSQVNCKPALANPKLAEPRNFTCISFYHFHPTPEERVKILKDYLRHEISELDPLIKGTLLISSAEGVNGAFVVPSEKLYKLLLSYSDSRLFHPEFLSFNVGDTITIPILGHIHPKIELLRCLTDDYQAVFPSLDEFERKQTIQDITPNIHSFLSNHYTNYKPTMEQEYLGVPKNFTVSMESLRRKYHKIIRSLQNEVTEYFTHHFPFSKLIIKEKNQILTDGLVSSKENSHKFDWTEAGKELSPEEWHEEIANKIPEDLKEVRVDSRYTSKSLDTLSPLPIPKDSSIPIILDCRNDFESDLGTFQNAIPLNTSTFRDTFPRLDILLKEIPKNQRILTFCTGGIRCVKVNAYLQQALGFQNTARLEKGIIAYEKWWKQQDSHSITRKNNYVESHNRLPGEQSLHSLFIGNNFLFDRRRMFKNGFVVKNQD